MDKSQIKICLFGGTFDPIHLGHTFIAQQAMRTLGLDKVIFLPCLQSPHKSAQQYTCTSEERLAMCQLATADLPWAEVSEYDLLSPPPSYSWRTAEHFKQLYPNAQLYWLMGADQWQSMPRWARADYFTSLLEVVVFTRNSPPTPLDQFTCTPLSNIQHPASATAVRKVLAHAQSTPWLHPKVSAFIKENSLYIKSPLD